MEHKKFLYTDGRDVVVTQSTFQTKKALYSLKGITDFGLTVLKPNRLPGFIVLLIGVTIVANGLFYFIPTSFFEFLKIPTQYATSNIQILVGAAIVCIGIALMLLLHKRYALRIETAEGMKNAVISKSKEYVDQIQNAIRKAKASAFGRR
ncbi:MAG TPA: DUF6232 family protein [Chryseolinea sp.]|nr:DUF6232 family protein [Chryseolinea sp.]HPM31425.1 DUF6232 family protein [Chryseolinea sp.]